MDGEAAMRAADALLGCNGGRSVLLRMPAPGVAGAAGEELGLATPEFQDVALGPAVFRKSGSTAEMLVSATSVASVLGSLAFGAVDAMFEAALGVVVDDVLYAVTGCVGSETDGTVFCYRVELLAPVW